MELSFYSIEKGEKWLTPMEKRQWREKSKVLHSWFHNKGIEISPWLQVRIRELLILTFFIQRLENELLFSTPTSKSESETENIKSSSKLDKISHTTQSYEILCKYLERQRKLVQEFEGLPSTENKTSSISLAELVQDLIRSAHELNNGNGKVQDPTSMLKEISQETSQTTTHFDI